MSGKCTLRTADRRHVVTALLGPTEPSQTGGRGGWAEVERPRRPGVTEWTGSPVRRGTVQLFLDAYGKNGSVSRQIAALNAMAPLDGEREPPVVYVSGAPPLSPSTPWVVQDVRFSEWVFREDKQPLRVMVDVDLVQRRLGEVVTRSSPAKRSRSNSGSSRSKPRTCTVKRGDTLGGIAARLLGSAGRWQEIARLNGLRSPNGLRVGQVLKLPTK